MRSLFYMIMNSHILSIIFISLAFSTVTNSDPVLPSNVPSCAKPGETFCEVAANYPKQLIQELFQKYTENQNRNKSNVKFSNYNGIYLPKGHRKGSHSVSTYKPKKQDFFPTDGQKIYSNLFEERFDRTNSLCPTSSANIRPQIALNLEGKWKYVYDSSIEIETCVTGFGQCNPKFRFPEGHSGHCKQKHVIIKRWSLQENKENGIIDDFKFPHGCECIITPPL